MTTAFICDKCGGIIGGAVETLMKASYSSPRATFRLEADLCEKCSPKVLEMFKTEFKNVEVEEGTA